MTPHQQQQILAELGACLAGLLHETGEVNAFCSRMAAHGLFCNPQSDELEDVARTFQSFAEAFPEIFGLDDLNVEDFKEMSPQERGELALERVTAACSSAGDF